MNQSKEFVSNDRDSTELIQETTFAQVGAETKASADASIIGPAVPLKNYASNVAEYASRTLKTSHASLNEDFFVAPYPEAIQLRTARVIQNRYQRTLQHLSTFMRVIVTLSLMDFEVHKTESSNVSLSMVLERTRTVEQLARQIEAEVAFMFMDRTIHNAESNPDCLISCLHVIIVYDEGGVPLKFDQSIQDALNSGDKVSVVAIQMDDSPNADHAQATEQRMAHFTQFLEYCHLPLEQWPVTARQDNETNLLMLLHNLIAITYFQEFVMQVYEIENLLFWLEVEMFRGTARQNWEVGCRQKALPEDADSDHFVIDMHDKHYGLMLLHARYIHYMFLARKASLRLNLPSDLISTVPWPLPIVDPVTSLHLPMKPNLFDDVQEHVFFYLAHYVFPRFLSSTSHLALVEAKENDPNEYEAAYFRPGEHFLKYHQDKEGMEKAVAEALVLHSDDAVSVTVALTGTSINKSPSMVPSGSGPNVMPMLVERTSNATIDKETASYFGNGPRLTMAQRKRRIQREKRLKKFFGERPRESSTDHIADSSGEPRERKGLPRDESFTSQISKNYKITSNTASPDLSDGRLKQKKIQKLEEFFGVTRLPTEQLFEQNLVDTIVLSNLLEDNERIVTPPTQNELPPDVKRQRMARIKKLRSMLGKPMNETMVSNSLYPLSTSDVEGLDGGDDESFLELTSENIRKLSTQSAESSLSLTTVTESVRRIRRDKEYRRKKVEKIQQFLGERLESIFGNELTSSPTSEKNFSFPKNSKERQAYLRRLKKLQNFLGEFPPQQIVARPTSTRSDSDDETQLELLPDGEFLLKILLANGQDVYEFVQLMEDFDRKQLQDPDSYTNPASPSIADRFQHDYSRASQRRRIGKLTRFFGSSAGAISLELASEERLMNDLGRHLADIVDPKVWLRLLSEQQQSKLVEFAVSTKQLPISETSRTGHEPQGVITSSPQENARRPTGMDM